MYYKSHRLKQFGPFPLNCEEILLACANLDASAPWPEFISCFKQEIIRTAYRQSRKWGETHPATVDDLVQETFLRLSDPKHHILARFKPQGPGSAHAFIHVVTKNLVIDHFKSLYSGKHGAAITFPATDKTDAIRPEGGAGTGTALDRELLLSQIDKCLQKLERGPNSERDRQIFWYHYRSGMSAREIAMLQKIGLTPKGVETVLLRLTRIVREFMVEDEVAQAGTPG